jgi:hypothetical protein
MLEQEPTIQEIVIPERIMGMVEEFGEYGPGFITKIDESEIRVIRLSKELERELRKKSNARREAFNKHKEDGTLTEKLEIDFNLRSRIGELVNKVALVLHGVSTARDQEEISTKIYYWSERLVEILHMETRDFVKENIGRVEITNTHIGHVYEQAILKLVTRFKAEKYTKRDIVSKGYKEVLDLKVPTLMPLALVNQALGDAERGVSSRLHDKKRFLEDLEGQSYVKIFKVKEGKKYKGDSTVLNGLSFKGELAWFTPAYMTKLTQ